MNERIQELIKQATECYSNGQERTFDKEKFAKLIIRECSKVIVNGGYRNPALGEKHPLTPPEIATMIQEHFGVDYEREN